MNEKQWANQEPGNRNATVSRRRLISYLLGISIVGTLGGVLTPIIGYLWPPSRTSGGGGRSEVGATGDFPPNSGAVVPVNGAPAIVVNTAQGMKAFSAVCTHLGCIVEWDQSRQIILCPCHDGRFNPANGAVISGPPPAPLPEFALTVERGTVYVSETS